ncbi:MAG TPA: helix-turn-helix transcriptional regulator [Flavobacteriales bacterium]|nr:helix-turn-helix transcriptional regulator [Flavobacteriales bacterium]
MNLGSTIKHFREQRSMSQKALAQTTGISAPYLSLLESNQRTPALGMIESIAKALGVPVPILMFHAMDEHDVPPAKRALFLTVFEPVRDMVTTTFCEQ